MSYEDVEGGRPLTWEEFKDIVDEDIEVAKELNKERKNSTNIGNWIYRGHRDSEWSLETTLERFLRDDLGFEETDYPATLYYRYLQKIINAVNSLTEHQFKPFKYPNKLDMIQLIPGTYEIMYYARHHGFPTPLLDWTKSYYVAAFFAFRRAKKDNNVAIFAYCENTVRGYGDSEALISQLGEHVETHPRHYKQQSNYTFCSKDPINNGDIMFVSHKRAVLNSENLALKKFILSAQEKDKVLEMLFRMNINDYTLFGSEESLMHFLAYKEFHSL